MVGAKADGQRVGLPTGRLYIHIILFYITVTKIKNRKYLIRKIIAFNCLNKMIDLHGYGKLN